MKIKYYNYLLTFLLVLASQLSYSQRRIAIYSQNNTSVANMQWANMTHYVYAFFNPMDNTGNMTDAAGVPNALCGGSVWFTTGTFTTRIAAARAANANIKIIISTGGAPASDPNITTRLSTIMASAVARTEMVNDLGAFIQQYNLDGFDFDWEHPVTVAEKNNHQTFLSEMKTKLNSLEAAMCKDLELSIALNGETDHFVLTPTGSDYVNPGVNASVDFYHLMTYDASYTSHNTANPAWPLNHSPLIHCQEAVRDFSSPPFNWPKSKMVIGIPFYGKTGANGGGGTQTYDVINGANSLAIYNDADDLSSGGYGYNACPTITAKVNFAKSEGLAGVVVWEGSQDRPAASGVALQSCIYAAMGAPPAWEKTCCEKPNLGNDVYTCNTPFPITLNSNTTTAGATFVWTRILPSVLTINASGSNTQSITSGNGAGTYVVARTAGSCTRRDTIVIGTALPAPNFGVASKALCDPAAFNLIPLNASAFPAATTWQWQKDAVNISGATTNTLYINSPGIYTLIANLTGCTQTSTNITVTTSTATAVDACRADAGTLNLSVSGTGPFTWYNTDIPGGTVIGTGSTYTTPPLANPSSTTYYVEDAGTATNFTIGPSGGPTGWAFDVTTPPTFLNATISMNFSVASPVKIRSVQVYPWDRNGAPITPYQATTFRIEIYNDNNNIVYTSPNIVWTIYPGYAFQTIALDANLVEGMYRMRAVIVSGGPLGLFHNNPTAFPYTGGTNNISITKQNGVAHAGPFFNWQISDFGGCKRIPVRAVVGDCSGVLPVELLYFNASEYENDVLLTWATAAETNNDRFIIQRSTDGENFATLGEVSGSGNSTSMNTYRYVDANAPSAKLYYRLIQIDLDGTESYSAIEVVDNNKEPIIYIAPNPFTNHATLIVEGIEGSVDLRIYDVSGKLVHTSAHNNLSEGVTTGEDLQSGFYIMELGSSKSVNQYKFIKE